jgi:L-rhamnose mutarotase
MLKISGGRLQRVCFSLNVRPDKLEEYKARHREVWPEMIYALRDAGWINYSLFLRPDGLLVGYLETPDFERAIAEMNRRDVNQRWQREMAPFFVLPAGAAPDQFMIPIEEIFHMDGILNN